MIQLKSSFKKKLNKILSRRNDPQCSRDRTKTRLDISFDENAISTHDMNEFNNKFLFVLQITTQCAVQSDACHHIIL